MSAACCRRSPPPSELELPNGRTLRLEPLRREGNRLKVGDFDPCVVLLNNDLSGGVPAILQSLEQAVLPPVHAGWATRRKSNHFAAYDDVTRDFAALLGIDPWLINPFFEKCGKINFRDRQGEECLEGYVSEILVAKDLGQSVVGGTTCQLYTFRQERIDWQLWIQKGNYPLPRKLVITTLTDEARPQYSASYRWDLAPSFNDAAFTFDPPEGAGKVVLAKAAGASN